jgi:hypothetical protein
MWRMVDTVSDDLEILGDAPVANYGAARDGAADDSRFTVVSDFEPAGDQPAAIESLAAGLEAGERVQTRLGITGSGKSATIAWTIAQTQRPTLILAPNKSLAAQLAQEMREFFPDNRVEYFVSYYDYYQPEAYIPSSDTYIEKDSSINDEIDRLRHLVVKHRPSDASKLVGQRRHGDIGVHSLFEAAEPRAEAMLFSMGMQPSRSGAVQQQTTQIAITPFADAQQFLLAARGVLSRYQAEPGPQITAAPESLSGTDRRHQSGRHQRTDAGDLH